MERLQRARVLVIGDVILDERIEGIATRLSPEAPVPVLSIERTHHYLGGAANVAANIASLGADVWLIGVVGEDGEAAQLRGLLPANLHSDLLTDPHRPTTRKTRIVAQGQQLLRIDRESTLSIDDSLQRSLLQQVERLLPKIDSVILSDYAKGLLPSPLLSALFRLLPPRPCVVDPKYADTSRYLGATLLTPNEQEARLATGYTDVKQAGAALLQQHPAVLITQGAEGATLFRRNLPPFWVPASPRPVYDRTGAGDTVAAVLGLALGAGMGMEEAVILANRAAGIVVGKPGTATVGWEEFSRSLK